MTEYGIGLQSGAKMPILHSELCELIEDLMVMWIFSATLSLEQAIYR